MTNYVQTTFFTPKDTLPTTDPNKTIFGSAYDVEFGNIATAIASKYDTNSTPTFLGGVTAPYFSPTNSSVVGNGMYLPAVNTVGIAAGATKIATFATGGSVFGTATGGAQGAGTINTTGLYVNGVAVGSSANPSATIGLAAVNGTASTFMTSDSAPPLSQAIIPTWTGLHTFNARVVIGASSGLALTVTGSGTGFGTVLNDGGSGTIVRLNSTKASGGYFSIATSGTDFAFIGSANAYTGGLTLNDLVIVSNNKLLLIANGGTAANFQVNGTAAPTLQGYGPTAAGLVDMTPDTGSFTITYTGFTAGVTGTAVWSRNGNQVILFLPATSGTSNATTFTATGIPAAINPTRAQNLALIAQGGFTNNGAAVAGAVTVNTNNTLTFGLGAFGTAWTNSGTKGVALGLAINYMLN